MCQLYSVASTPVKNRKNGIPDSVPSVMRDEMPSLAGKRMSNIRLSCFGLFRRHVRRVDSVESRDWRCVWLISRLQQTSMTVSCIMRMNICSGRAPEGRGICGTNKFEAT